MTDFPAEWQSLSAALSHDWLSGMRGGERVLELLCDGFPAAPIYTLLYNADAISDTINRHDVHTSCLQGIPGVTQHYRRLLPLFPAAVRGLRPPPVDLLISTSHCVAKAVRPAPGTRHLCYCFTPMRYAWLFFDEYFGTNPVKALLVKPLLAWLRRWDRRAGRRVHRFVGISNHVRDRIRDCYGREADVVYPPVAIERWTPDPAVARESFDLVVSALVPYKRIDLAVETYTRSGHPLAVVGVGGCLASLRAAAGPNITFLERQTDEAILDLYRRCRLLVFPGEEDFGIVPVEAQACGAPVAAYRKGGATETVVERETGVFFDAQTPASLQDAVDRCVATTWDVAALRRNAERFSTARFIDGLAAAIDALLTSS